MRPNRSLLKSRPVQVTAGVLMLTIPTSAAALSAGAADAQGALGVTLNHRSLTYGQTLVATGVAPRADSGRKLLLEIAPRGGSWQVAGSTLVRSDGHFRLVAKPRRSGTVKVVEANNAVKTAAASADGGSTASVTSVAQTVNVAAVLHAPLGSLGAASGQPIAVSGTLLPRSAGRTVLLQSGSGHGWRTVARARTRANGRFRLRYGAGGSGSTVVRVRFNGDRFNGAVTTRAAQLTFFRQSVASWYNDGGATACGFHATYGVANKDLPCGTKVTFRYGGRTVTATVDDRGPYVGGRDWDLNQNTAGALGFNGVATVWSSR